MPDDDKPGESGTTPPAPEGSGAPPATPAPEAEPPKASATTSDALARLEREAAKVARERDALAARLKAIEDSQKSEDEKRAEELERLRATSAQHDEDRKRWAAERAVLVAAPSRGIADVALAMAVVDLSDVEFDADGNATNIDDVLGTLVEKHPVLVASGEPPKPKVPSTEAKKGGGRSDAPKLTADEMAAAEAFGMTPDEYARYKGQVTTADTMLAPSGAGKE